MSSVIDICNLALSHLGERATVSSIDPPEGSAQASNCAIFYPIARDTLLELAKPTFARRRAALSLYADTADGWAYAYARPADALVVLSVSPPGQSDDAVTPAPWVSEAAADGSPVIYTHVEQAQVRYIARIEDTVRFSPLFVEALSWHLASMLAGPILKGDVGAAESKRCEQMMIAVLARASTSDLNQGDLRMAPVPSWIGVR